MFNKYLCKFISKQFGNGCGRGRNQCVNQTEIRYMKGAAVRIFDAVRKLGINSNSSLPI